METPREDVRIAWDDWFCLALSHCDECGGQTVELRTGGPVVHIRVEDLLSVAWHLCKIRLYAWRRSIR